MKLSIVIAVLNSHEMFRRQMLHWSKMILPDDIEWVIMDDGSDPPLTATNQIKNFVIHPTNDFRPWTTSIARNSGAKLAQGEYLLMTDIDHIITQELIMRGYEWTGGRMNFKRYFGVLDENGNFTQDLDVLRTYGLQEERIQSRKGLRAPPHGNSFVMPKKTFWLTGGYNENGREHYPPMDETHFRNEYRKLEHKGLSSTIDPELRPIIYLIPNGYYCGDPDYNPMGLFHNLSRASWGFSKKFLEIQRKI